MSIISGYAKNSGGNFYPYEINSSLKFNDDDSAYLQRAYTNTPADTNNLIKTFSFWVKRCNLGIQQSILSHYINATNYWFIGFDANDKIKLVSSVGTITSQHITTAVYRDVGQWYHICVVADTTNATTADRIKLYVNGTEVATFDTNTDPALNAAALNFFAPVSGTWNLRLGAFDLSASKADMYQAEAIGIDGQALDPTSFGEFKDGVWIPKEYTGSYGTNGFHLDFADSGAIGNDISGNNNDFTPTNLVAADVVSDSPTQNTCTYSSISTLTVGTLSDGNLSSTGAAAGTFNALDHDSYWEITANAVSVVGGVKAPDGTENTIAIANGKTYGFRLTTAGALDYINITDAGSWTSLTTGLTDVQFPYAEGGANTAEFGAVGFVGTIPSGYAALNATNLPGDNPDDTTNAPITLSGTFDGNLNADGPDVTLGGVPETMTINGNAVTFGTHADKTAKGFKVRTASASYNNTGSNTFSVTVVGSIFKFANAQENP